MAKVRFQELTEPIVPDRGNEEVSLSVGGSFRVSIGEPIFAGHIQWKREAVTIDPVDYPNPTLQMVDIEWIGFTQGGIELTVEQVYEIDTKGEIQGVIRTQVLRELQTGPMGGLYHDGISDSI